jgi:hypothetical protein
MKLRQMVAVGVLGGSALVAPLLSAQSASATPSGCSVLLVSNREGYSRCNSGSGGHRVVLYCKNLGFFGGSWKSGPWRNSAQQSWASCPWGSAATYINYEQY